MIYLGRRFFFVNCSLPYFILQCAMSNLVWIFRFWVMENIASVDTDKEKLDSHYVTLLRGESLVYVDSMDMI